MLNLVPLHRAVVAGDSPFPLETATIDPDDQLVFLHRDEDAGSINISVKTMDGWQDWPAWPGNDIVTCLADGDAVVSVLENGDIVEANAAGAEIVGGFDEKVLAAEWSPDQELVCVVLAQKMVIMSRGFDLLGSHEFADNDLDLSRHVSVGWGKKETQFQGRGARAMRDPTMPEQVDTGLLNDDDAGSVQISWRGDGEHVALSTISAGRRVVRVFGRDGTLSAVSEPCDHLGGLVAWQPRGALIASVQTIANGEQQVVFFERNGLRRYEFQLPESGVLGLAWSPDSDILAVRYASRVELWTTKNYHWYRKSVVIPWSAAAVGNSSTWMQWHPVKARTLLVAWGSSIVETASFTDAIARDTKGTVAVIDGNEILVTNLAKAVIPPPFSQFQLPVRNPIHVAVDDARVAVATIDSVVVFEHEAVVEEISIEGVPRQVAWNDGQLAVLSDSLNGAVLKIGDEPEYPAPDAILLKPGIYHNSTGEVFSWQHDLLGSLGRPCMDVVVHDQTLFGITRTGQLIAASPNAEVIAHGITSMALAADHLLITQPNFLKFLHLEGPLAVPADDEESEQVRRIERGSFLVSILQQQTAVVLEHPRGNLETIYPRMLVVGAVRREISALNYGTAFILSRKNRVDMNLLVDYAPEQFYSNLALFVKQIGSVEHMDLFLSNIRDEDVTQGKYRETAVEGTAGDAVAKGKVNKVTNALLEHVPMQNQLTAYAYMDPPQLETALKACTNDDDVRHLCFLTDAELLYRTALGMYDLNLTLQVAQYTQKDPKEYLAFLRARQAESELRRRFSIDDHLKRYERALTSLMEPGVALDDELLAYIEAHDLHAAALVLPSILESPGRERVVLASQGQAFKVAGDYLAAGLNFELVGDNERAVEAYKYAGAWQRALSLDSSPEQAEAVAEALVIQEKWAGAAEIYAYYRKQIPLAVSLYAQAYQYDAAVLLSSRMDYPPEGLDLVDEAMNDAFGTIRELIADCQSQVGSQLKRLRETRTERAADALGYGVAGLTIADDVSVAGTETTAAASYVTKYTDKTGGTAQTGASRRTQKNRRREERKKARGRKGTVYEEEYLIASTGRLIERLDRTRPDAAALLDGLRRRDKRVYAVELKKAFSTILETLKEHIPEIYAVEEKDLVRYNDEGEMYTLPRPVAPTLPAPL